MNSVKTTAKKIKDLEIQGARNIAVESLKSLARYAKSIKAKSKKEFFNELKKGQNILLSSRPTEPMMRNTVRYATYMANANELENINDIKKTVLSYIDDVLKDLEESKKKITVLGEKLIPKNATILTHCHSSTVTEILKSCKNKNIKVICTETRPLYQGRITASELVNAGIKTSMIIDSAAKEFIRKCDMILMGADVITLAGVYNKIGSGMISHFAEIYDIPMYVAAESWKFDPETVTKGSEIVEKRSSKEIWNNPPKNLELLNPAFDFIEKEEITGIITEDGIITPDVIHESFRRCHPWMFD
jgi:ribose 1,5-bisphosphate isomerase